MTNDEIPIFDADNHYYEAHDAFTRHVPKHMQSRCVQWLELENGRKYHVIGGWIDRASNPAFNPISKPGVLRQYFRGNPENKTSAELVRSALEPMPPEYMDRDARIARLDEQRLDAAWLFPTQGVLYEEPLKKDLDAVITTFTAFNRWLEEDWGLTYKDRLYAAPYISLCDVEWACKELEWALERDARMVVMRPSAVFTRNGPRNPGHTDFRPLLGARQRSRHHRGDAHRRREARQQRIRQTERRRAGHDASPDDLELPPRTGHQRLPGEHGLRQALRALPEPARRVGRERGRFRRAALEGARVHP